MAAGRLGRARPPDRRRSAACPGSGPSRPSGWPTTSSRPRPRRPSPWPRRSATSRSGSATAETCFHLTEADEPLCSICRDPRRDAGLVCVVEQPRDLMALETCGDVPGRLSRPARPARALAGDRARPVHARRPRGPRPRGRGPRGDHGHQPQPRRRRHRAARRQPPGRHRRADHPAGPRPRLGQRLEFANKEMLADALNGRQTVLNPQRRTLLVASPYPRYHMCEWERRPVGDRRRMWSWTISDIAPRQPTRTSGIYLQHWAASPATPGGSDGPMLDA